MEASVVSEFHADGMTGPVGSGQWAVLAEDVCPGVAEDPGQALDADYHVKSKNGESGSRGRADARRSAMSLEWSGCRGRKGTGRDRDDD